MITRELRILTRMKEHLNELKKFCRENDCEFVALFLQGSQNYELDEYSENYQSDIDTKAIIVPSLNNIIDGNSPISTTLVLENDEHIDVKDIRVWVQMWEKQNISYLEVLFSKFFLVNDEYLDLIEELHMNADNISRFNVTSALKCMAGMSKEKLHALKHPYPAALEKINKFGYDPKQLHHIYRMKELVTRYVSGESLHNALIPNNKSYLMDLKKGFETEDRADVLSKEWVNYIDSVVDEYISNNTVNINISAKNTLYKIKSEMIRRYIRKLVLEE